MRGVDLRAVGNEPGWLLELDHERGMLVLLNYGETILKTLPPRLKIYPMQIRTETHRIEIITEDKGCRDVMSGEYSPLTVTMTVNGTPYSGCGRHLNGG